MTQEEAKQIYLIKKEIRSIERSLKELKEGRIYISSPAISDMPKGSGGPNDKKEERIDEEMQLEQLLSAQKQRLAREEKKFLEFVETVPDAEMRIILRMRCYENKGWEKIGREISCDRRTASRKYYGFFEDARNARPICDKV